MVGQFLRVCTGFCWRH